MNTLKTKLIEVLKVWMGEKGYCSFFHTAYSLPKNPHYWYCSKCKLQYLKSLSDNDNGVVI